MITKEQMEELLTKSGVAFTDSLSDKLEKVIHEEIEEALKACKHVFYGFLIRGDCNRYTDTQLMERFEEYMKVIRENDKTMRGIKP